MRAGVLEQGTVELLVEMGVGERLRREGLVHTGVEFRFGGEGHRIAFDELTGGRAITIYGQQEVVKDLIAARIGAGLPLLFEVDDVRPDAIDTDTPAIRYRHEGTEHELQCDFIAGCDGFHGVCRDAVPGRGDAHLRTRVPVRLARDPGGGGAVQRRAHLLPSRPRLRPAQHALAAADAALPPGRRGRADRRLARSQDLGGAAHPLRQPRLELNEGPIIEKGIAPMRSFVAEPMQHGRLFLAGDAVHIVPATGAKGLNLAVADVRVLADALARWFDSKDNAGLNAYSDTRLRHVWAAQHFASWMTTMLHRMPDDADGFNARLQRAQLAYVCSSHAAATSLAENYVGPQTK